MSNRNQIPQIRPAALLLTTRNPYFSKLYFNSNHQLAVANHRPEEQQQQNSSPHFIIIPYCKNLSEEKAEIYRRNLSEAGAIVSCYKKFIPKGDKLKDADFFAHFEKLEKGLAERTSSTSNGLIIICDIPTLQIFQENVSVSKSGHEKIVMLKLAELLTKMKNDREKYPRLICAVHSKWLTDHCFQLERCVLPIPLDLFSLYDDAAFQIPQEFRTLRKGTTTATPDSSLPTDYLYYYLKKLPPNNNNNNNLQNTKPTTTIQGSQKLNLFQNEEDDKNHHPRQQTVSNSLPLSNSHSQDKNNNDNNNNNNNNKVYTLMTSSATSSFEIGDDNNSNGGNQSNPESPLISVIMIPFNGIFKDNEGKPFDIVQELVVATEEEENSNLSTKSEETQNRNFVNNNYSHQNQQQQEPEAQRPLDNFFVDGRTNEQPTKRNNDGSFNFTKKQKRGNCPNQSIVDHLRALGDFHYANQKTAQDGFRAMAYRKAAFQLEHITFQLRCAEEIPIQFRKGIGEKTLQKINEIIQTGTTMKAISFQQDPYVMAKQALIKIWGVGPATAKLLAEPPFNIKSVQELRNRDDALAKLNPNQLIGLKYYEDLNERIPRAEVDLIQTIVAKTLARCGFDTHIESSDVNLKSVCDVTGRSASSASASIVRNTTIDPMTGRVILTRGKVELCTCGSFRRGHANSGDVDILISSEDQIFGLYMNLIITEFQNQHAMRQNNNSNNNNDYPKLPEAFELFQKLVDGDPHFGGRNEINMSQTWMGIVRVEKCADPKLCPCQHKPDGSHVARRVDLKAYREEHIAFAKLYFTGSAYFNRALRWFAHKNDFRLSDIALSSVRRDNLGNVFIKQTFPCRTEKEIFDFMNLTFLEPSERDVTGKGFQK